MYISQDPIGLLGNNPNFYAYVKDVNAWIDAKGLNGIAGLVLAGNTSGPYALRTPQDVVADSNGIIKAQSATNSSLSGKSVFNNADNMSNVLSGTKVHEITSVDLPEGLDIKADGVDVGGTRAKGHLTIFNTRDMTFDEFKNKISELETKKIGSIDKKGNFTH